MTIDQRFSDHYLTTVYHEFQRNLVEVKMYTVMWLSCVFLVFILAPLKDAALTREYWITVGIWSIPMWILLIPLYFVWRRVNKTERARYHNAVRILRERGHEDIQE